MGSPKTITAATKDAIWAEHKDNVPVKKLVKRYKISKSQIYVILADRRYYGVSFVEQEKLGLWSTDTLKRYGLLQKPPYRPCDQGRSCLPSFVDRQSIYLYERNPPPPRVEEDDEAEDEIEEVESILPW